MTGKQALLDDMPAVEEQPARRDARAEQRRFVERENEKTDIVRALNGLPPLYTPVPDEGACSSWQPKARTQ